MSALHTQVAGSHYKALAIQPIEYIHANGIPFAEGCVIKYVSRWRAKGGIKDLEKARHFIDLLIELETKAMNSKPFEFLSTEVQPLVLSADDPRRQQYMAAAAPACSAPAEHAPAPAGASVDRSGTPR